MNRDKIMRNQLRKWALDFSRATCRDGLYNDHEQCLLESNDFIARVRHIVENRSSDCQVLADMFNSYDYYEYFLQNVSFHDLAINLAEFDQKWMDEVVAIENEGSELERAITNAEKYPNIVYLKRTCDNYIESYDRLETIQQQAMAFITKDYVPYTVNSVKQAAVYSQAPLKFSLQN